MRGRRPRPFGARRARRARRPGRVLGRALGAGRDERRYRVPVRDQPRRRLQLPRARASRPRPVRLSLDQPGLPLHGALRPAALRNRDPTGARRRSADRRVPPRPGSPRASRSRARGRSTGRRSSLPSCWSTEYAANFELRTVINRCGVIAGPWQMGSVDQGVFTFWLLHHRFGRPLSYIGYGGTGKQVRDLLHVEDLIELVDAQLLDPEALGRLRRQRRRRSRRQPLARGDDRDLPRADRERGRDRAPCSRTGPATFRYTSPTARGCSSAPIGGRGAALATCSPTSTPGSGNTRTPWRGHSGL